MKSEYHNLALLLAVLLLELSLSQGFGRLQLPAIKVNKPISEPHEDEVIDLKIHSGPHSGKKKKVGVLSGLVKKLHQNSPRNKPPQETNTQIYQDDETCGRVPIFEHQYAESINETDYKLRSNFNQAEASGERRILHGTSSAPGEWPWLAKLHITRDDGRSTFECSGSLLNGRWILTAAHCLEQASQVEATLGLSDLLVRDKSAVTIKCDRIIKHANATKTHNDVALLRLSKLAKYDKFIRPVCLMSGSNLLLATKQSEEKKHCHTIGFGLNENLSLPSKLQKLEIREASCKRLADDVGHELPDVVCMLPRARMGGTCRGDSGGPNVCYNPAANRWNLVGVTSFGPTDCNQYESDPEGWLTGSMDLKKYREWAAKTIEKHGS